MMRASGIPAAVCNRTAAAVLAAAGALESRVRLAPLVPFALSIPFALLALPCALPCGAPPARAQVWSEFGARAEQAPAAGVEIREPFFAFLLAMAESDSLGSWTGQDLCDFAVRCGRPSKLPLADLVQVRRARPEPDQAARWPGVRPVAVWRLRLDADLSVPMPYSILGYHPGSLLVSGGLDFTELWVGQRTVEYRQDKETAAANFDSVRIFALTAGRLVLDADGFVDALLGSALDDSWTLGFVTAREDGNRLGVGVSLGRNGRRIYGEFDFARDKILPGGRPSASALSGYSRHWLDPEKGNLPAPWE